MKRKAGFTLIEAVIALAIWMILSVSVIFVWQHVSSRTSALLARQNAFENARVSMDALIANLQMAQSITLYVVGDHYVLRQMTVPGIDANGRVNNFVFDFDCRLTSAATRYRRLEFGENELASNIAVVRVRPIGVRGHERHINITVETGCEFHIVLEGSVDIRYTNLIMTRLAR